MTMIDPGFIPTPESVVFLSSHMVLSLLQFGQTRGGETWPIALPKMGSSGARIVPTRSSIHRSPIVRMDLDRCTAGHTAFRHVSLSVVTIVVPSSDNMSGDEARHLEFHLDCLQLEPVGTSWSMSRCSKCINGPMVAAEASVSAFEGRWISEAADVVVVDTCRRSSPAPGPSTAVTQATDMILPGADDFHNLTQIFGFVVRTTVAARCLFTSPSCFSPA